MDASHAATPNVPSKQPNNATTVRIPPDWTRDPHFPTQSALLEARKEEKHALSLAQKKDSPYFDRNFRRTKTLFNDTYRKSGIFERAIPLSPVQEAPSSPALPAEHHGPRAMTSPGFSTRSELFDQRQREKRMASLKFEPLDIERLQDLPKTPELRGWWKQVDGFVNDPSTMMANSIRLKQKQMQHKPNALVEGVDPTKARSAASVEEQRLLRENKARLAPKVIHISHTFASDHQEIVDAAVFYRAPDLYAQLKVREHAPEDAADV